MVNHEKIRLVAIIILFKFLTFGKSAFQFIGFSLPLTPFQAFLHTFFWCFRTRWPLLQLLHRALHQHSFIPPRFVVQCFINQKGRQMFGAHCFRHERHTTDFRARNNPCTKHVGAKLPASILVFFFFFHTHWPPRNARSPPSTLRVTPWIALRKWERRTNASLRNNGQIDSAITSQQDL